MRYYRTGKTGGGAGAMPHPPPTFFFFKVNKNWKQLTQKNPLLILSSLIYMYILIYQQFYNCV